MMWKQSILILQKLHGLQNKVFLDLEYLFFVGIITGIISSVIVWFITK